jgi:hypothetical protein
MRTIALAAPAALLAQAPFTQASLLTEVNQLRASKKLPALQPNAQLDAAAKLYADDLAKRNATFEQMTAEGHRDSKGRGPVDRAKEAGYTLAVTENTLLGSATTTARQAYQAWFDSPGHQANMLTDFATDSGFAAAKGTNGNWYFVHKIGGKLPPPAFKLGEWVQISKQGGAKPQVGRVVGASTRPEAVIQVLHYDKKDGKDLGTSEKIVLADPKVTVSKL